MHDTHPDAERRRIELLREVGAERRATIASDLTNAALRRARRGIAEAHPDLSETERKLLFVEVHYGPELAEGVRARLRSRSADDAA